MPQLIAMIIVVVGAMIYMFQTFGGTGDKIEGIAQKTSVLTEINNIKDGVKLALRAGDLVQNTNLRDLANLDYFDKQINEQIKSNVNANKYYAISFGGKDKTNANLNSAMVITLIHTQIKGGHVGLKVDFPAQGKLGKNAGFLESQLSTDLKAIASIDRTGLLGETDVWDSTNNKFKTLTKPTDGKEKDGSLSIYYKDLPAVE